MYRHMNETMTKEEKIERSFEENFELAFADMNIGKATKMLLRGFWGLAYEQGIGEGYEQASLRFLEQIAMMGEEN